MAVVTRNLSRWTRWHLVGAILFAALGVVVTSGAFADIFQIAYYHEESSHIFLVPLIAIWMVWVRAARIRYCRPSWTFLGPAIIAIGWLGWSYGYWYNRDTYFHAGAVLVVLGCVVSVLGRHVIMRFFPAVAVLVFLIPVPAHFRMEIAGPLQKFTAVVSQSTMQVLGENVHRSGSSLTINDQPIDIAEACNGMRMVFALILVSYAFCFGLPLRQWVRALVMMLSPIAAIFCNVIRIIPTIWIYAYCPRSLFDTFHSLSGWAMLPIAFLLLLGLIRVLRWR